MGNFQKGLICPRPLGLSLFNIFMKYMERERGNGEDKICCQNHITG